MIRFTWLESRAQILVAVAGLIAVAVVGLLTGPHLVHLYNSLVAPCQTRGDCPTATAALLRHDSTLRTWLGILVIVVPGLAGIFWGAPLVAHELETGTYRLAWTQSVTRTRWLATKLIVLGLASMALAGLLSLAVTWWASPLDHAHAAQFATFDQRDLGPVGYAALAFALGVTAGVIIRRSLPAMAATLVVFVGTRIAITQWLRPHLLAPAHTTLAVTSGSGLGFSPSGPGGAVTFVYGNPSIPNGWVLSSRIVDNTGRPATAASLHQFLTTACPAIAAPPPPTTGPLSRAPANQQTFNDCLSRLSAHYHLAVTYQPASHYWPLQWYETGIFLAAALILAGFAASWVRRRRI